VSDLKVNQANGVAEAHYRFDLSLLPAAVDSTSVAVMRGNGALSVLGGWLLEPRGYDRVPIIDIRMATGPGLVFAAACPRSATPGAWPAPACASQATPRWAT